MKTTATFSLASPVRADLEQVFCFNPKHIHINQYQDYSHLLTPPVSEKKETLSFSLTSQQSIEQSCKLPPCQQKAKESIVVVSLLSFLWTFYCLFNSQVLIILCSKVQTSSIYFDKVSKKLFVCFQR